MKSIFRTLLRRYCAVWLESSGLHLVEESLDPYYASSGVRLFLDSAYYAVHCALHASLKINRYDTIWMVAQKP